MSREAHVRFSEGVGVRVPRATRPSESLCRWPRGAGRHRIVDELLQPPPPSEVDPIRGTKGRRN